MVLARAEPSVTIIVPDHDVLRVGLLRKLIEQMGVSVEEFLQLLE